MASLVESAVTLMFASLSTTTCRFYHQVLDKFLTFTREQLRVGQSLPASRSSVTLYVSHLPRMGYAASTVASHLSALAYFHKILGFADPTDQFFIKKMLQGMHKLSKCGDTRYPISLEILTKLIDSSVHVTTSSYEAVLLKSMYALMFHGFMRIGEVTNSPNNIQFSHVTVTSEAISITFHNFKHHCGPPVVIKIPASNNRYCPVYITLCYLSRRRFSQGPFFAYPGPQPVQSSHFSQLRRQFVRRCFGNPP